jgi:hypothetical protein
MDNMAVTSKTSVAPRSADTRGLEPAETGDSGYTQTLYILVSKGFPKDSENARMIDFCIVTNDSKNTNTVYRLDGRRGQYGLKVVPGFGNPRLKPHFVRQFHVATLPVRSPNDTTLHELVTGISISNENPEYTRWMWIDSVLGAMSAANLISSDEGTSIIDATIDCVSSAPYPG